MEPLNLNLNKMNNNFNVHKVHEWVEKVINSCENYKQTLTAKKLINNFYDLMKNNNVDISTRCKIEYELQYKLLIIQDKLSTNF